MELFLLMIYLPFTVDNVNSCGRVPFLTIWSPVRMAAVKRPTRTVEPFVAFFVPGFQHLASHTHHPDILEQLVNKVFTGLLLASNKKGYISPHGHISPLFTLRHSFSKMGGGLCLRSMTCGKLYSFKVDRGFPADLACQKRNVT